MTTAPANSEPLSPLESPTTTVRHDEYATWYPSNPLPAGHPPVEAHTHKGTRCPVTGADPEKQSKSKHHYCPPQEGDIRGVCPALNTMANHGYIPRDGKNISVGRLIRGLRQCYGITLPLATFLASGGYIAIRKWSFRAATLTDFGLHGKVEHNASLVHGDTHPGEKYPPPEIIPPLVSMMVGDVRPEVMGPPEVQKTEILVDEMDVARSRVRREKESPPLGRIPAQVARGEMAIILGVWHKEPTPPSSDSASAKTTPAKSGIPLTWLLEWLAHEKLPEGWKPTHEQGFFDVRRRNKLMESNMKKIRDEEAGEKKSGSKPSNANTSDAEKAE